jgi:hypothetical protein
MTPSGSEAKAYFAGRDDRPDEADQADQGGWDDRAIEA